MEFRFEWDATKARLNRVRHGVTFDEAATIFGDPLSVSVADSAHSRHGEARWVTIGESDRHRLLVVVHTERAVGVRLISARRANGTEREAYEAGIKK